MAATRACNVRGCAGERTLAVARFGARSQLRRCMRGTLIAFAPRALRSPPITTPTAETIIVNKPTLSNDSNTIPNQRRLRLVKSSRRGPRADRDTALGLLRACLATEMRCVAEIVRYARSTPEASR
jgi:hypothetical protein